MNQLVINPFPLPSSGSITACGQPEIDYVYMHLDRIIGFETLEILPILAAGIFVFRTNLILNCTN